MLSKIKKRLSSAHLFGKNTDVGPPLQPTWEEAVAYFENVYQKSNSFVDAAIERFNIRSQRILSIGAGVGAEEILFAQHGNNAVTCLEPDRLSLDVAFHFAEAYNVVPLMTLKQSTVQNFRSEKPYDLIYSSSPSDWMYSDFRQIIPDYYIKAVNRLSAPKSILLFKLYGGSFRPWVLKSNWFLQSLAKHLATNSRFRLREYWLSKKGRIATIIASTDPLSPPKSPSFAMASERYGETSFLRYKEGQKLPRHIIGPAGLALYNEFFKKALRKIGISLP